MSKLLACGTKQCSEGKEFCVTQRFTSSGEVIKSECYALPSGCKESGCAESHLPVELKEVRKNTWTDATSLDKVKITFHMINPDGLPLANKVSEKVEKEKLFLRIKDRNSFLKADVVTPALPMLTYQMYAPLRVSRGPLLRFSGFLVSFEKFLSHAVSPRAEALPMSHLVS